MFIFSIFISKGFNLMGGSFISKINTIDSSISFRSLKTNHIIRRSTLA
ncbi:hypothetical protein KP78_05980 [Jeotgalibacillus soli]|uniref:Uncharacterized protein n=1 Tax=Jeotgalibacillus soli TaxID=889306 RepID=A0A0C2VNY1_9BACL|nr:hypothetical protein KP78_05980 [Jeotgalibacillus soli]